jgi:hypothetical protein
MNPFNPFLAATTQPEVATASPRVPTKYDWAAEDGFFDEVKTAFPGSQEQINILRHSSVETAGGSRFAEQYNGKDKDKYFINRYGPNTEAGRNLGNKTDKDAATFYGRGPGMLTGRYNYERVGKALNLDLINHPELAESPKYRNKIAVEYLKLEQKGRNLDFKTFAGVHGAIRPHESAETRNLNPIAYRITDSDLKNLNLYSGQVKEKKKTAKMKLEQGNIDTKTLPFVDNPNGKKSSVSSITVEMDGTHYVLPTVIDGKIVSPKEAIESFKKTKKHLGGFETPEEAEARSQKVHQNEEQRLKAWELENKPWYETAIDLIKQ